MYWEKPSAAPEAAAAGADDAQFRALGAVLVKDGFAGATINLGREMTGGESVGTTASAMSSTEPSAPPSWATSFCTTDCAETWLSPIAA